jgi:ABC-type branched-subunit amino acid transport system substrate-binding protein
MTRKTSSWYRLLALLFIAMLVAGACGGSDDDDEAGGGQDEGNGQLATVPGFDGTTIKVGVLTPLSGPVAAPIGIPLTDGGRVYWQKVNAAGGVAGKYKVEAVEEDTQYDTPPQGQTRTKYTKIKNDVVMFSQILGTPPTKSVLQELKTDKIAASPASLDAAWVREPNLLPIGSTYQLQFINGASYLIEDKGFEGKPICMMAIEGEYGDAGVEGLEFAANELDFEVATTARYKPTDTDFTAQIQQLRNANCAAVFLTSLPSGTGAIIGAGARAGFNPQWVGQSPTWVGALAAPTSPVLPVLQKNFLWVSEGTTWGDESVPGMKELIADQKKYKPDQQPDVYFTFGYVQALAVHALLEKAVELGDLSREGILKAIEEVDIDYKGLLGDYTYGKPADRDPSRSSVIFSVDPSVPGALKKVTEVESDAAKAFKFE